MNNHRVEIIAYLDRATGVCACGYSTLEIFGNRRTANAKQKLMLHLESAFSDEYQIKDGQKLVCPRCHSDLDLAKGDLGKLDPTDPSVVTCEEGHEFQSFHKNRTLFLFPGSDGPFSTF